MKFSTYPPFLCTCICNVQLPDNKSRSPDIRIKLTFHINHWGDIQRGAMSEAAYRLERLGVEKETLQYADFEVADCDYVALEPRGVRREEYSGVEAFYHCDPKKREVLIRQRRLVPESQAEMVELYGKPVAPVKADAEAVPA